MQLSAQPVTVPGNAFQRALLAAMLAERALLVRLSALGLLGAALGLGSAQIARLAIDEALPATAPRMLLVLTLGALLVGAHQAWAGWLEDNTATELGARLERGALERLLGALLESDPARLPRRDAGWMGDTLGGASGVVHGYVAAFVALVTQSCFGLSFLGMLVASAPLAAALVAAASLGISMLMWSFVRWESRLVRAALDASSGERELLNGLVSSLASVRGLFATERLGARWQRALLTSALASTRRVQAATLRGLCVSGVARLLGVGVTSWAVYRCLEQQLGIGQMLLYTSMAAGLSGSILSLCSTAIGYRALAPQFERMNELLAAAPLGAPRAAARPAGTELELDDVWFRYSDAGRWVLRERNFRVQRGACVQLDAPSGSGKSTLLRVLAGLATPTRGHARVFGLDASEARDLVLYVPQHCELFETTIGENLRLLSAAGADELDRVSRLTGLSELLARLPLGAETPVAARGQNLSSGQRQLIVLTAAFASKRPVLLLDEAMSQIDAATRRRMRWAELTADRTIVAVEHGHQV